MSIVVPSNNTTSSQLTALTKPLTATSTPTTAAPDVTSTPVVSNSTTSSQLATLVAALPETANVASANPSATPGITPNIASASQLTALGTPSPGETPLVPTGIPGIPGPPNSYLAAQVANQVAQGNLLAQSITNAAIATVESNVLSRQYSLFPVSGLYGLPLVGGVAQDQTPGIRTNLPASAPAMEEQEQELPPTPAPAPPVVPPPTAPVTPPPGPSRPDESPVDVEPTTVQGVFGPDPEFVVTLLATGPLAVIWDESCVCAVASQV